MVLPVPYIYVLLPVACALTDGILILLLANLPHNVLMVVMTLTSKYHMHATFT